MELADRAGLSRIVLLPLGYEFDDTVGDEYDDNWLVIAGDVTSAGRQWSFRHPSLLVDEARGIADWLDRVADRIEAPGGPRQNGDTGPDLVFIEPNLGLTVLSYTRDSAIVRLHLALEALPAVPIGSAEPGADRSAVSVDVEVTLPDAAAAAAVWRSELAVYPRR